MGGSDSGRGERGAAGEGGLEERWALDGAGDALGSCESAVSCEARFVAMIAVAMEVESDDGCCRLSCGAGVKSAVCLHVRQVCNVASGSCRVKVALLADPSS